MRGLAPLRAPQATSTRTQRSCTDGEIVSSFDTVRHKVCGCVGSRTLRTSPKSQAVIVREWTAPRQSPAQLADGLWASQRLRISAVGVAGTLGVHLLLLLPFLVELSLPPPRLPNRSGAGASALASSQEPVMTAVFINESAPPAANPPPFEPEELASRGLASMNLPVVVVSPDAEPASDTDRTSEESSAPPEAVGDQAQHAILYGRYLNQIQARIERAWIRPRSEVGASRFRCRARVEQDRAGAVVNVRLERCNGSQRWQRSLSTAIRAASPLPAPPDPSVYADALLLVFESDGYSAGSSGEGFEPAGSQALVAATNVESLKKFSESFHGKEETGVVHLTIIGTPRDAPEVGTQISEAPRPMTEPVDTSSNGE